MCHHARGYIRCQESFRDNHIALYKCIYIIQSQVIVWLNLCPHVSSGQYISLNDKECCVKSRILLRITSVLFIQFYVCCFYLCLLLCIYNITLPVCSISLCIYWFKYWKSGTSDHLLLMLFVYNVPTINILFLLLLFTTSKRNSRDKLYHILFN